MRATTLRAAAAAATLAVASGCASSTVLRSEPPGAKVFLNGELAGRTPLVMTDTKIVGSITHVRLVLDGYRDTSTFIQRNEQFDPGACLGGVFVYVPFLWIMGYKPEHLYELTPMAPRRALPPRAVPPDDAEDAYDGEDAEDASDL
jgi:hypothetical protein